MPLLSLNAFPEKSNIIILHMFPGGARSHLKEWPDQNWMELIQRFLADGFEVHLTGTEANRLRAESLCRKLPRIEGVRVVAGSLSLSDTARELGAAKLVVSVDTGIMHIASAMGCDLVSLHGPTSPRRWGPLNANAIALTIEKVWSPCLSLGSESSCQDPQCMIQLGVDRVYGAARRLLAKYRQGRET